MVRQTRIIPKTFQIVKIFTETLKSESEIKENDLIDTEKNREQKESTETKLTDRKQQQHNNLQKEKERINVIVKKVKKAEERKEGKLSRYLDYR